VPGEDQQYWQFQLKEYEQVWAYFGELYRERRAAVRFLITALPGIPGVVYAAVQIWGGDEQVCLDQVAPWMTVLLVFLYAVGWCYFEVLIRSRERSVELTRRLNMIRKQFLDDGPENFAPAMEAHNPDWVDPKKPELWSWGVDFWYLLLVVVANSVVAGAAAGFWPWGRNPERSPLVTGAVFVVVSAVVMVGLAAWQLRKPRPKPRAEAPGDPG
jgi:hypothetical protein